MWRSIVIKLRESKEGIQRGYKVRHTSEEDTILNSAAGESKNYSSAYFRDRPVGQGMLFTK